LSFTLGVEGIDAQRGDAVRRYARPANVVRLLADAAKVVRCAQLGAATLQEALRLGIDY
jgi:hypothetical protein